jgi:MOSC domain-containing protein YiiM
MTDEFFPTVDELQAGLDHVRHAPKNGGVLEMIVRRPQTSEREVVDEAQLDRKLGLVGDNWLARGSRRTPDLSAHPEMQITVMNSRAIALLARQRKRWALAGDQLFVDLDLSEENLPPGTRLAIGSAVLEVTAQPHTGCKLFTTRFGSDATQVVNSEVGKQLRLRGLNAKVVQAGTVRKGDAVNRL